MADNHSQPLPRDLPEPPYMARLADACRRIEKARREVDLAVLRLATAGA